MKYLFLLAPILIFGCKNTIPKDVIGTEEPKVNVIGAPDIPTGALNGNFNGDDYPVYAYVKHINTKSEITYIGFENEKLPEISIPESIGAELYLLKLKSFKNDVLLVNAKLKDTNFNEYYVFVLKNNVWKQPVNRFNIHKSNMNDSIIPVIIDDPKSNKKLLRYYSVFDMDRESEKKFSWKLRRESVSIED